MIDAEALEPRYHRLAEVLNKPLSGRVTGAIDRVRRHDALAVVQCPVDNFVFAGPADVDWMRRHVAAGPRAVYEFADPYPVDVDAPVGEALDERDATGDVDRYERALRAISRREPRDIDAWAHTGQFYLTISDPTSPEFSFASDPEPAQRKAWLRLGLALYETGVAVGECQLPDRAPGCAPWRRHENRPFLRAVHGLALALWRLGRFDEAERALLNLLWLNPSDEMGARTLLAPIRSRRPWLLSKLDNSPSGP